MKTKTTFVFLFFFCSLFSFAQTSGRLTILSENGEKFFVFINNQKLNNQPQSAVLVDDLGVPVFELAVAYAGSNSRPVIIRQLWLADGNGELNHVTYKLKRDRRQGRAKLQFASMLPVDRRAIIPRHYFGTRYYPEVVNEPQQPDQPVGCVNAYPMKANDFADALNVIKEQGFDETKLKIAKQIVSANCLDTNQIVQVCNLFGFEASKLDFAKFAFDFCVDPNNYYKVSNVFSFSASTNELSEFVQGKMP